MQRVDPLNPLATTREIREMAGRAFERGASSAAIRAEIAEMKKRTAALQALRMKPTREERPSRRTLKAQRAEINQQLAQVQTDIAARGGPAPPPPAAMPPRQQRPKGPELKPAILDPREIVPPHMIEKFREEFRASQMRAAEERLAEMTLNRGQQQDNGTARMLAAADNLPRLPEASWSRRLQHERPALEEGPTLEEFQRQHGFAVATPPEAKGVRSRVHGVQNRRAFAQFPGSQSISEEGASPSGKRRIAPPL